MPAWVTELHANATRPLLARVRYLDDLKPRADFTPDHVLRALEDDDDPLAGDVARGLVRLVPKEHWLSLAQSFEGERDGHFLLQSFVHELDFRLLPVAFAALEGPDAYFALRLLLRLWEEERLRSEFEAAWPGIERRIGDADFKCAYRAIDLATRGRRTAGPLIGGLERVLAAAKDARGEYAFIDGPDGEEDEDQVEDFVSYDLQVEIETLFWHIAHVGPALRPLSPSLAPFLTSDIGAWRSAALLAAIGVGADSLRPAVEARLALGDLREIERCLAEYALWSFGGAEDHLARALAQAAEDFAAQSRLENALELTPVTHRGLRALGAMAADPTWTATACRTFAKMGPPAAETLRALPELAQDDAAYVWDCEARWRCGLRSSAETRVALESTLDPACALEVQAWGLYVELAADDPVAMARVRDDSRRARNGEPCGGALIGAPHVAARVLPELMRGGREDLVLLVQRALPSDAFWSALGKG